METLSLLPVALAAVAVTGSLVYIRATRLRALGEVMASASGEVLRVQEDANCFGVDSLGAAQVRGNGCLALTRDELLFHKWLGRRALRIPRGAITAVDAVDSHLGKSVGRTLFRVSWRLDSGEVDSVAWLVKEPEAWLAELRHPPSTRTGASEAEAPRQG